MFKAVRRVVGVFTALIVMVGVMRSLFTWLANCEDDNHEVFIDEDESELQF